MGALIFLTIIFISCGSTLLSAINMNENVIFDHNQDGSVMDFPKDNDVKLAIDENNDLENHFKTQHNEGHRMNDDDEEYQDLIDVHKDTAVESDGDFKSIKMDGRVTYHAAFSFTPSGVVSSGFADLRKNSGNYMTLRSSSHQISARAASNCKYPTNLKDSELDCTIYPSRVVCIHTCMFGHTLETGRDGIRRTMECKFEENKWRPVTEFEKCKPFIDCGVTIGPGGAYKCRKNFMDKGTECDISCSHYEDKDAVPEAKYQCDINGNWTPELPFCAKAGSGLKLVRAPSGPKTLEELKN